MPPQDLHTLLDGMPAAGQVILFVALAVGIVLWIFGRRLAKPVCALTGALLGTFAGLVIAQATGAKSFAIVGMVAGGVAGLVLSWLLFRVFMALSLGVVLAIALPAAGLAIRGTAPPPVETQEVRDQFVDLTKPPRSEERPTLHERLATIYQQQVEETRAWWDGLGKGGQRTVIVAAIVGVLAGLIVGIIFPKTAASIQSALIGGGLMLGAGWQLLRAYSPDSAEHLPHGPRTSVVAVGLITILGVLLQWTLSRRKADK